MSARFHAILVPASAEAFGATRAFYADGLGLSIKREDTQFCWIDANDTTLMLHVVSASHPEFAPTGNGIYLEFASDDLDATVSALLRHGGKAISSWTDENARYASIRDPAGNMVELFERQA